MSGPTEIIRGSAAHRRLQAVGWGAFTLVVVILPFLWAGPGTLSIGTSRFTFSLASVTEAVAMMVAILGINLLVGFTGQISLGNSFFIGLGAYLTAVLVQDHNWSVFLTPILVIPVCFLVGVLVGIPALRIRGLYLALITLTLATVFPSLVRLDSLAERTGGSNGKSVGEAELHPPFDFAGLGEFLADLPLLGDWVGDWSDRKAERVYTYFVIVVLAAISFWLANNIMGSRVGRAFIAIRDNETGAAVSGVNLPLYKSVAFGTSAVFCGFAGTLYIISVEFVAPDSFGTNLAIFLIVGLVVGGVASTWGPVVGGLVIIFVPRLTSQINSVVGYELEGSKPYGTLVLGLMLVALTFVLPGGIVAGLRKLRERRFRIVAAPVTATAPSAPLAPSTSTVDAEAP